MSPPPAAADFRLPALDGGERSLSEARGSWVVLTFFATWCGPCRAEMPTLERLHRERGGRGITVLGVSLDDRREPVEPFLRQLGVSFPVLWDERGEAARAYRAASIPVTYLIDPGGRVRGVARGARDWSGLSGMMTQLAALEAPAAGAGPAYAAAALDLPPEAEPPTATVELSPAEPRVGRPFHLDVRVRWAGSLDRYLLLPPSLSLPAGIEQRGISAETTSTAGRNALTYRLALAASRPGEYALTPVEVRYAPHGSAEPLASRIDGPTVRVRPRTVAGLAPAAFAGVGSGTLAVGLVAYGLARRRRRRSRAPAAEPGLPALEQALAEARRLRLSGDGAGSFLSLARIERELGVPAQEEPRLAAAEEAARYGGQAPPPDELDHWTRRAERRLAELSCAQTHGRSPGNAETRRSGFIPGARRRRRKAPDERSPGVTKESR